MSSQARHLHQWVSAVAALAVWLALGWPFLHELATGAIRRASPVPALWLLPYGAFGAAVLAATVLPLKAGARWTLLCAQFAAVLAMTIIFPKDLMTLFLIVVAWQVGLAVGPVKAVGWVALQTLAVVGTVAQGPDARLSYIIALSLVLQLCSVFTAQALRREAQTARALARTNGELQAAQKIISNNVRDAERLRISRALNDAWSRELTALGQQLENASRCAERARASDHVMQAKGLARDLLAKVRGAVATLRDAERHREALRPPASEASRADYGAPAGANALMADQVRKRHHWIFGAAALAVTIALGTPVFQMFMTGKMPVSAPWLAAFTLFGTAALAAIVLKLCPRVRWALLCIQLGAVAAMAFIASWAMMSAFLIITAWQVATATGPAKALGWVAFQTLLVIGMLALAPKPDLCWVIGKSFALQLFFLFAAQALRREAETARALARTNDELRAAQAIIANAVRDAERLRISRELHDAWGHELTALGLQLEIASHLADRRRADEHVAQAKGLTSGLLAKVRDVVSALREAERHDLKDALEALARSVPRPAIHVTVAPGLQVSPDQAHALIRCAQEAVTNAVRHSDAANLWLQVKADDRGVRLVARNDGNARPAAASAGLGLVGMRERLECLGGRLAVGTGGDFGFTVDAWLPSGKPQAA